MAEYNKNDRNRYVQLNGDPIHTPTLFGFWKNKDVQIVSAGIAFATAASYVTGGSTEQLISMSANGAMGLALHQAMERLFEKFQLRRHFNDVSRYCIDKKPTAFSLKTSPTNKNAAEEIRNAAMHSMIFLTALTPFFYFDDFANAAQAVAGPLEDISKNGMSSAAFSLSWMLRNALTYFRFNNVVNDRWNIVHPPQKPQKKESWLGRTAPGL